MPFNKTRQTRYTAEYGGAPLRLDYYEAIFDLNDFEIHNGCLKINEFQFCLKKVICTKIEVDRPYNFGENVWKMTTDL